MEDDAVAEANDDNAPTASTSNDALDNDELPAKWVKATRKRISTSIGAAPNVTCGQYGHRCTSRKRLLIHARVHLVHSFCRCGYGSKWRESIRKHQTDARNSCDRDGPVYEVDRESFASWRHILGVSLTTYPSEDDIGRIATPLPQALHLFNTHLYKLPLRFQLLQRARFATRYLTRST